MRLSPQALPPTRTSLRLESAAGQANGGSIDGPAGGGTAAFPADDLRKRRGSRARRPCGEALKEPLRVPLTRRSGAFGVGERSGSRRDAERGAVAARSHRLILVFDFPRQRIGPRLPGLVDQLRDRHCLICATSRVAGLAAGLHDAGGAQPRLQGDGHARRAAPGSPTRGSRNRTPIRLCPRFSATARRPVQPRTRLRRSRRQRNGDGLFCGTSYDGGSGDGGPKCAPGAWRLQDSGPA